MALKKKPRLSVWKFASCDGCQLSLLDCEDELLAITNEVELAFFVEASRAMGKGPYDLTLVDGSITTAHDAELIKKVRRDSKYLVAMAPAPAPAASRPCATSRTLTISLRQSTPIRNTSRPWNSPRRCRPISRWTISSTAVPSTNDSSCR